MANSETRFKEIQVNTQVDKLDDVVDLSSPSPMSNSERARIIKALSVNYEAGETVKVQSRTRCLFKSSGFPEVLIDLSSNLPVLPKGYYWHVQRDAFTYSNCHTLRLMKGGNKWFSGRTMAKKIIYIRTSKEFPTILRSAAISLFFSCFKSQTSDEKIQELSRTNRQLRRIITSRGKDN